MLAELGWNAADVALTVQVDWFGVQVGRSVNCNPEGSS